MLFFRALKYIPASTTSLILYLYPLIVLIESVFLLKDKFKMSSLISIVLIMGGCCLVFYDAFLRDQNFTGILLASGAALSFGTYITMSQVVLKGENASSVALYMVSFTALAYVVINGGLGLEGMNYKQLSVGVGLGVIPSAIAVLLLYKSIEKIGAAYASIFSSFEPVATLVMAAWILGEKVVVYQIYGVALLVAGIVLPNLRFIFSK
jgi:drug/metabolite transporter (DMT)-like permease